MIGKIDEKKLINSFNKVEDKKIGNKTFKEEFSYEGISVWWLLKEIIIKRNLPKKFCGSLNEMLEHLNNEKKYSSIKEIFYNISTIIIKKILLVLENTKVFLSKTITKNNETKSVLFLTFMNQIKSVEEKDFGMTKNVIKEIKKKKLSPFILIYDPLTNFSMKNLMGIPSLYAYIKKTNLKEIKSASKNISKKWKNLDEKTKTRLFLVKNKNIYKYLKCHLNFIFSYEIINLALTYYETLRKIINDNNITLTFLTGDSSLIERALLAASYKNNNISLINPNSIGAGMADYANFKNAHFACFGKEHQLYLLNKGIHKDNIHIIGSLILDEVILKKEAVKLSKKNKKRILFITQAVVEKNMMNKKKYFRYMKNYLTQLSKLDVEVIVKLHPFERNIKEYLKIAKKVNGENIKIIYNRDRNILLSLIKSSDLVLGFRSSSILFVTMVKKPFVKIDLFDKLYQPDYNTEKEDEVFVNLKSDSDITRSTEKILFNKKNYENLIKKQEVYMNNFLYKPDGKTYKRISNLIQKLINSK